MVKLHNRDTSSTDSPIVDMLPETMREVLQLMGLNQHLDIVLNIMNCGACIAGGAVQWLLSGGGLNDIDIFLPYETADHDKVVEYITSITDVPIYVSLTAITIKAEVTIQIVRLLDDTVEEVLTHFDIIPCKVALSMDTHKRPMFVGTMTSLYAAQHRMCIMDTHITIYRFTRSIHKYDYIYVPSWIRFRWVHTDTPMTKLILDGDSVLDMYKPEEEIPSIPMRLAMSNQQLLYLDVESGLVKDICRKNVDVAAKQIYGQTIDTIQCDNDSHCNTYPVFYDCPTSSGIQNSHIHYKTITVITNIEYGRALCESL